MAKTLIQQAAANIARCIGNPPTGTVTVLYSPHTADIAGSVVAALQRLDLHVESVMAKEADDSTIALVTRTLEQKPGTSGCVVLLDPSFAPIVFDVLGRPDRGLKRDASHLFSDWFIRPGGLIRTYAIDLDEQERFRRWLLQTLADSSTIRVTTPDGTDITLVPRHWNTCWGEVFTAPMEGVANGTLVVDGSLYFAPSRQPFTLQIQDGRVTNLAELDHAEPQQQMLWQDLTCDDHAAVLAELGIGINQGADPCSDVMEAEQARGTCHFGFGNNIPFGGRNVSRFHGDVCILRPTITVDGRVICRNGMFMDK